MVSYGYGGESATNEQLGSLLRALTFIPFPLNTGNLLMVGYFILSKEDLLCRYDLG